MRRIGLGFGFSASAASQQEVTVFQTDTFSLFSNVETTQAAPVSPPLTDPATGIAVLDIFETVNTAQHNLAYVIPYAMVMGRRYRLEVDCCAIGDRKAFLYNDVAGGSYLIGSFGSATPDLTNHLVSTGATDLGSGFYRMSMTFDKDDATAMSYFIFGLSLPAINTFYAGETNKGFKIGRVSLIDVPV